MTGDEAPCSVCGSGARGQGGYLQCECPAPIPVLGPPQPDPQGGETKRKCDEDHHTWDCVDAGYTLCMPPLPPPVSPDQAAYDRQLDEHIRDGSWEPPPVSAEPEPSARETAWLIEWTPRGCLPRWFDGSINWTEDAGAAIRFARKSDAERAMPCLEAAGHSFLTATVTEHVWLAPASRAEGEPPRFVQHGACSACAEGEPPSQPGEPETVWRCGNGHIVPPPMLKPCPTCVPGEPDLGADIANVANEVYIHRITPGEGAARILALVEQGEPDARAEPCREVLPIIYRCEARGAHQYHEVAIEKSMSTWESTPPVPPDARAEEVAAVLLQSDGRSRVQLCVGGRVKYTVYLDENSRLHTDRFVAAVNEAFATRAAALREARRG